MNKRIIAWIIFLLVISWNASIFLWIFFSPQQPISKYLAEVAISPVSLYCSVTGGTQSVQQQGDYSTLFRVPGDSCSFHEKDIIDPGFNYAATLMNQEPTMCSCGPNKCWNGYRCISNPL